MLEELLLITTKLRKYLFWSLLEGLPKQAIQTIHPYQVILIYLVSILLLTTLHGILAYRETKIGERPNQTVARYE